MESPSSSVSILTQEKNSRQQESVDMRFNSYLPILICLPLLIPVLELLVPELPLKCLSGLELPVSERPVLGVPVPELDIPDLLFHNIPISELL